MSTIQPYLLTHAAARATFYPDKLARLTQAAKKHRLTACIKSVLGI